MTSFLIAEFQISIFCRTWYRISALQVQSQKTQGFALKILWRYLPNEGRLRKLFHCLIRKETLSSKIRRAGTFENPWGFRKPSFNTLGCLDQILWKGCPPPPSVLQRDIKPSAYMAKQQPLNDFINFKFEITLLKFLTISNEAMSQNEVM